VSGLRVAAEVAVGVQLVADSGREDGTGSLRIPASACGLVGLKPSRGRTSIGPARSPGLLGNIVEHVLTRSVRDTAAVLDAVAGTLPGDLFTAEPPCRAFIDEVGRDPGHLRVGLLLHDPVLSLPVHSECLEAVRETGEVLEGLGHEVEESAPSALGGPSGLGLSLRIVSASGLAARLDNWSERIGRAIGPDDVEPATWERAEEGRRFTAVQVHAGVRRLVAGVCRVPEWWASGFDLLVTPTMQQPPPLIGAVSAEELGAVFGLFAMPFSISGQPAISLPLHWSSEGLPIGVQLVANSGREDVLIRVASQLEQAKPWKDLRPTCHVSHPTSA
jgi:amidase